MSLVFVGLGSNIGDGRENLLSAWKQLGATEQITALSLSSPYLSEPVGMESDQWFTNAVGVLETRRSPEKLLVRFLEIEAGMGRDRTEGMDRTIDLDVLYYDDLVVNSPGLTLPHPDIHNRLFVLAPLTELAPDHVHPIRQQTSAQMRRDLRPDYRIKKVSWESKRLQGTASASLSDCSHTDV